MSVPRLMTGKPAPGGQLRNRAPDFSVPFLLSGPVRPVPTAMQAAFSSASLATSCRPTPPLRASRRCARQSTFFEPTMGVVVMGHSLSARIRALEAELNRIKGAA